MNNSERESNQQNSPLNRRISNDIHCIDLLPNSPSEKEKRKNGTGTLYLTHINSCEMEVTMYEKGAYHAENAANDH